jgi:glycerophosphoryl diester phosphodiesterase
MFGESDWGKKSLLIIAHRGASVGAPENTMAAFRMAAELHADAIELDAKLSADGVIVVHHDSTLDRTTSGHGPLAARPWSELRELDAGSHFGEVYAGERIPALREVLEELGKKLMINIELTNYARPLDSLPQKAVALVRELGLDRRILFSSFNPIALRRVKRMAPQIPCGLLLLHQEPSWIRQLLRRAVRHDALNLDEKLINLDVVKRQRAAGRKVYGWTVNDERRMRELIEMGIDGLITDLPEAARKVKHSAPDPD